VGSKDYTDRVKRDRAFNALVAKYRQVDSSATREEVKKKLYGLRSSYRRELLKLKKSVRTENVLENVYKPQLWYFYLFDFLSDNETMKEPTSTSGDYHQDVLKEEEVEYDEEVEALEHEADLLHYDEDNRTEEHELDEDASEDDIVAEGNDPFSSTTPSRCTRSCAPSTSSRSYHCSSPKKRKLVTPKEPHEPIDYSEEPVEPNSHSSSLQSEHHREEDQFDVYGKLVAHKLRTFDRLQVTFSQRLINEV
uniref:MADF domain-containing protein n=1 Tax=Anopheles epiroticus TaxID=199890 RepID=A0A182P4Z6_9DIPT